MKNCGIAALIDDEIAAIAMEVELMTTKVEDDYVENTCDIGELNLTAPEFHDLSLDEEDNILHSLITDERQYRSVEQSFGYVNKKGEYMLKSAIQSIELPLHSIPSSS